MKLEDIFVSSASDDGQVKFLKITDDEVTQLKCGISLGDSKISALELSLVKNDKYVIIGTSSGKTQKWSLKGKCSTSSLDMNYEVHLLYA